MNITPSSAKSYQFIGKARQPGRGLQLPPLSADVIERLLLAQAWNLRHQAIAYVISEPHQGKPLIRYPQAVDLERRIREVAQRYTGQLITKELKQRLADELAVVVSDFAETRGNDLVITGGDPFVEMAMEEASALLQAPVFEGGEAE